MNAAKNIKFRLPQSFVSKYAGKDPAFGFNGLGELVFYRTYSRVMLDGHKEQWFQTVERVVNGTFNMQKGWLLSQSIPWNEDVALNDACEMYDRIFTFKFLPPGRGLWAMGTSLIEERRMFAALNNCAFVSTADITNDPAAPFCFLMDASMLGVGVGFDTKGAGKIEIIPPAQQSLAHEEEVFSIEDSREGWVNALRSLIEAYTLCGKPLPKFDFSKIRQEGAAIRTFGGTSQGPGPLRQLLADAGTLLASLVGRRLTVTAIVDLMNFIGRCVIAGNVRRTAEIAFGSPDDQEYIELKNYKVNSHRESYAWVSNNSVFASLGMEYSEVTKHCRVNGEPGFAWLENMQAYGRMVDHPNFKDANATGGNPCLEQTLESYEMCCLVETFPEKHESIEDYLRTLDLAFLYAKTVTLGPTKWEQTNSIMTRNRRIGTSMSGIAQFIAKWGLNTLKEWCEKGYERVQEQDHKISAYFNINRSVKTTSVKPSGTVSLLAGATPGVHFPEARFYLRRVRLAADSDLLPALRRAGYRVEPSVTDPGTTVVVEVPVDAGSGVRTLQEVSMWEQLALAAFLQKYWADNQVSCTVTFDPETEGSQLEHALDFYQYQLKGVSFLPKLDCGAFPQMPYEKISERRYYELTNQISLGVSLFHGKLSPMICGSTISRKDESNDDYCPELFCDSDKCTVDSGGSNISSRRSMDTTQPPVVVVQQQKEKQQKRMKAAVAKINNGSDDDASSNNKENKPPAAAEREFGVFPLSPVIDMVSECTTTIDYHKSQMMLLNSNEKKKSFHFLEL